MSREEAIAIVHYLSRAFGIVPTTGAEWTRVQAGLATIEGVANGTLELKLEPKATQVEPA